LLGGEPIEQLRSLEERGGEWIGLKSIFFFAKYFALAPQKLFADAGNLTNTTACMTLERPQLHI